MKFQRATASLVLLTSIALTLLQVVKSQNCENELDLCYFGEGEEGCQNCLEGVAASVENVACENLATQACPLIAQCKSTDTTGCFVEGCDEVEWDLVLCVVNEDKAPENECPSLDCSSAPPPGPVVSPTPAPVTPAPTMGQTPSTPAPMGPAPAPDPTLRVTPGEDCEFILGLCFEGQDDCENCLEGVAGLFSHESCGNIDEKACPAIAACPCQNQNTGIPDCEAKKLEYFTCVFNIQRDFDDQCDTVNCGATPPAPAPTEVTTPEPAPTSAPTEATTPEPTPQNGAGVQPTTSAPATTEPTSASGDGTGTPAPTDALTPASTEEPATTEAPTSASARLVLNLSGMSSLLLVAMSLSLAAIFW